MLGSVCSLPSQEELEEGALLVNLCSLKVLPRRGAACSLCARTGVNEVLPVCALQLPNAEKAHSSWVNSK